MKILKKKKEKNTDYIYEINGEKTLKESTEYKVKNGFKCTTETGGYISGGVSLASASIKSIKAINLSSEAAQLGTAATQLAAEATQATVKAGKLFGEATKAVDEFKNMNFITKIFYYSKASEKIKIASVAYKEAASAIQAAKEAAQTAKAATQVATEASASTMLCRIGGTAFLVFGIVLGVGLGGYFTHKFCEELIDKFVEYYKSNADKLSNSYKEAAQYFKLNSENSKI